ncbi:hypothetical protein ACQKWADRAFT_284990 [Trichoderma austrokoningii]
MFLCFYASAAPTVLFLAFASHRCTGFHKVSSDSTIQFNRLTPWALSKFFLNSQCSRLCKVMQHAPHPKGGQPLPI